MIAEDLAGKRIAVTGSTGFLGTALVERLLRSVPDCELVLLVRAGPHAHGRAAGPAGDLQERLLRPPARPSSAAPTAFDELVARRVQVIAGDVGTDGLGLDEADGRDPRLAATSSSTRPPR